jgi:nicotinamidase-related amidase
VWRRERHRGSDVHTGPSEVRLETEMERRQFLQSTVLGATAAILGVSPLAAATPASSLQENLMIDPTRPYEPLTSENAALILIDHQVGLMTGVRDYSTGELKHNVVALAKTAKALKLPIVVTTTARDSMWGPTFPELVEALPDVSIIDRSSVNAFDDPKVAQAITATGRKKLIFAGISLEVRAAFPAITAIGRGLDAYVAVDAQEPSVRPSVKWASCACSRLASSSPTMQP